VRRNWRHRGSDRSSPASAAHPAAPAMNDQIPGGANFFEPFRQLVIVGYFTSEVGITQEREYLPVPGEYNGEFLYSKVNKVYSS
ncbi:MAG: gluconate 2-dehydrogenase subunit 3 family protein, partial [Lysobacteraceae bacterium]